MDIISTICYIVLFGAGIGMCWGFYLMYIDWLWNKAYQRMLKKGIQWPVEPVSDVEYREIARFD